MTTITILATKCYCSLLLSYPFFQMLSTCVGLDPVILPCLQGLLSSGLHHVHVIQTSRELYERDGITCVMRNS